MQVTKLTERQVYMPPDEMSHADRYKELENLGSDNEDSSQREVLVKPSR